MELAQIDRGVSEPATPRATRGADRLRLFLLVMSVLLAAYAVVFGARVVDYHHLQTAVATGQVPAIEVTPGLVPGSQGVAVQQVSWKQGWREYRTEVQMISPGALAHGDEFPNPDVFIIEGLDVTETLRVLNPGLQASPVEWRDHGSAEFLGYSLPSWAGILLIPMFAGVLGLLVGGPAPWRATRWAWFWLLTSPVGWFAFLILSGPTPFVRAPKDPERRLTGGWAFILSWFLP